MERKYCIYHDIYFAFIGRYHQPTESMIFILYIPCKAISTRLFQIFKKSLPVILNSKKHCPVRVKHGKTKKEIIHFGFVPKHI